MPKAIELRNVIKIVKDYGVKFDPKTGGKHSGKSVKGNKSFPVKTHGMKTMILAYALKGLMKKFELPSDAFDRYSKNALFCVQFEIRKKENDWRENTGAKITVL